ncbi:hypothetical protein BaRGS_00039233 [Batillaria attramentaria]|uniref:MI domain-containing protein n=1 Tax=Batillaria attramentaria TaxID=370345 RepID=A0ABD0J3H4_9CAEN
MQPMILKNVKLTQKPAVNLMVIPLPPVAVARPVFPAVTAVRSEDSQPASSVTYSRVGKEKPLKQPRTRVVDSAKVPVGLSPASGSTSRRKGSTSSSSSSATDSAQSRKYLEAVNTWMECEVKLHRIANVVKDGAVSWKRRGLRWRGTSTPPVSVRNRTTSSSTDSGPSTSKASMTASGVDTPPPDALNLKGQAAYSCQTKRCQPNLTLILRPNLILDAVEKSVAGKSSLSLTDFERAIAANFESDAGSKSKKAKLNKIRRLSAPNQRDSVSEKPSATEMKSSETGASQPSATESVATKRIQQSRLLQSILNKKKGGVLEKIPKIPRLSEAPRPFEEILKSPPVEPLNPFLARDPTANPDSGYSNPDTGLSKPDTGLGNADTGPASPEKSLADPDPGLSLASAESHSKTPSERPEEPGEQDAWDFDSGYHFDTSAMIDEDYQSPAQTWEVDDQGSDTTASSRGFSLQGAVPSTSRQAFTQADNLRVVRGEEFSPDQDDSENPTGSTSCRSAGTERRSMWMAFEADSSTNQTDYWPHPRGEDGKEERLMTESQLLQLPDQPWQVMMREWNSNHDDVLVTDMLENVSEEDEDMPDSHETENTPKLAETVVVPETEDTSEPVVMPDSQAAKDMTNSVEQTGGRGTVEVRMDEVEEAVPVPSTSNEAEVKVTNSESSDTKGTEVKTTKVKAVEVSPADRNRRSGQAKMGPPVAQRGAGETVQFIMEQSLGSLDRNLLWSLMDMYISAGALPQLFSIFFDICKQGLFNTEVCNAHIRLIAATCTDLKQRVIQKMLRRIFQTFSTMRIKPAGDCLLFLINAFSVHKGNIKTLWQLFRYCNILPGFSVPLPIMEMALRSFIERPVWKLRLHVNKWIEGAPADTLRGLDPTIVNNPKLRSSLIQTGCGHLDKVLHGPDEVVDWSSRDGDDEGVELVRDVDREQYFLHRIQECRRSWNLEYLAKIFVELCSIPYGNRVFERLYADILLDHVSLARVGALVLETCFDEGHIDVTIDLLHVLVDSPVVSQRHLVNKSGVGQKVLAACVQLEEPKLALKIVEGVTFSQDASLAAVLLQQLMHQLIAIRVVKGAFKVLKILTEKNLTGAAELAVLTVDMIWHALGIGDIGTALDVLDLHEKLLSQQHPLPDPLLRALLTASADSGYVAKQQDLYAQLKKRGVYSVLPFVDPPYIIQLNSMFTPAEIKMLMKERLKELYSKLCDDAANERSLSEMDVTVAVDIFFEYDPQMMSLPFLALGSRSKVLAVRALGKMLELHMTPPLSARYDIRSGLVIIEPVSFIGFLREMDAEGRQLGLAPDDDTEEKEPTPSHSGRSSSWKKHKRTMSPKSHRHSAHQSKRHSRPSSPRQPSRVSSSHSLSEREGHLGPLRDMRSPPGRRRTSFHRDRDAQSFTDTHRSHFSPPHTGSRREFDTSSTGHGQRHENFGHSSSQFGSQSHSPRVEQTSQFSDSLHMRREGGSTPSRSQQHQEEFGRKQFNFRDRSRSPARAHQPWFSSERDSNGPHPSQFGERSQSRFHQSDFPSESGRKSDFPQTLHREFSDRDTSPGPSQAPGLLGPAPSQFPVSSLPSESRPSPFFERSRDHTSTRSHTQEQSSQRFGPRSFSVPNDFEARASSGGRDRGDMDPFPPGRLQQPPDGLLGSRPAHRAETSSFSHQSTYPIGNSQGRGGSRGRGRGMGHSQPPVHRQELQDFEAGAHRPSEACQSPTFSRKPFGGGRHHAPPQDRPPPNGMPPPSDPARRSPSARPPPMRQMSASSPQRQERRSPHRPPPPAHKSPQPPLFAKLPLLPDPPKSSLISETEEPAESKPPTPSAPQPQFQPPPRPLPPQNMRGMRPGLRGHPRAQEPAPPRHAAPQAPQQGAAPRPSGPHRGRPPRPWRGHAGPRPPPPGFRQEHERAQHSSGEEWDRRQDSSGENWEQNEAGFGQQNWGRDYSFPQPRGRGQAFRGQRGPRPPLSGQRQVAYRNDQEHVQADSDANWGHKETDRRVEFAGHRGRGFMQRPARGWRGVPPGRGRGSFGGRGHSGNF